LSRDLEFPDPDLQ